MKFDKNKAFPFPVLRPYSDDFVDKEFQTTVDFACDGDSVTFAISYALSSRDILQLIQNQSARFISVISCRDTYFSVAIKSFEPHAEEVFSSNLFRGEVEVRSYIHIERDLEFVSTELHKEFGGNPIHYKKNDIIAQDETAVLYFDRELFKSMTSVFDLVKNDSLSDGAWELKFDQDHVQIQVAPDMKMRIDEARNSNSNKAILINSLYFAAAMQAIEKIKLDDGSYDDYRWATVIRQRAHNLGINISSHDSYIVAERLLRNPLSLLDSLVFSKKGAE